MVYSDAIIVASRVLRMSKGKPPFFKNTEKERRILYIGFGSYLFIVLQDRIASVILAQE